MQEVVGGPIYVHSEIDAHVNVGVADVDTEIECCISG